MESAAEQTSKVVNAAEAVRQQLLTSGPPNYHALSELITEMRTEARSLGSRLASEQMTEPTPAEFAAHVSAVVQDLALVTRYAPVAALRIAAFNQTLTPRVLRPIAEKIGVSGHMWTGDISGSPVACRQTMRSPTLTRQQLATAAITDVVIGQFDDLEQMQLKNTVFRQFTLADAISADPEQPWKLRGKSVFVDDIFGQNGWAAINGYVGGQSPPLKEAARDEGRYFHITVPKFGL